MESGILMGLGQWRHWRNAIQRAWLYVAGITSLIGFKGGISDFSRSGTAIVTDFEGLLKTAKVNEARFEQLRRVKNLISHAEDFSQPEWVKTDGTATVDLLTSTAANATFLQAHTAVAGDYVFTVDLKREAGASFVKITTDSATGYETLVLSANKVWQRFTFKQTLTAGAKNAGIQLVGDANQVYARRAQLELVAGQSDQNPSEYTKPQWQNEHLCFDGINDFVTIGDDTVLDFTTAFTIVAKVRPTEFTRFNTILSKAAYHLKVNPDGYLNFGIRKAVDGTTWTLATTLASDGRLYALAVFKGYLYVGTGDNGKIYRTSDGTTWAEAYDSTAVRFLSFAVWNGYLYGGVDGGGKVFRSSDGTTWAEVYDSVSSKIFCLTVFDGYIYGGADTGGRIYRSANGTDWEQAIDTLESFIFALAVFDGYLYAGTGDLGKIYRTNDGTTWVEVEDLAEVSVRAFAVFDGYLYAGTGNSANIYRSSDGTTWALAKDLPDAGSLCLATFNNYLYVGCSSSPKIYRTDDGTTWTEVENTGESEVRALVDFKGHLYAATTLQGKIFRMDGGADIYSDTALSLNAFTDVAATYDNVPASDNLKLYINGALNTTGDDDSTVDTNALDLLIGDSFGSLLYGDERFNGVISEVKLFNRALTAPEIVLSHAGQPPSGLVAQWGLSECEGEIAYDASGNNNHGTLKNFSLFPKYYDYEHANTVASKQVTEVRGDAITTNKGILVEGSVTNYAYDSEFFSDLVTWSKNSITVTENSVAAPNALVTADTLTAGGGAFVRQTRTLSVNDWVLSVWLKRKTGTGDISLSIDNGVTAVVVPVTTEWDRYFITQASVTNPALQIIIGTSGDEIYAWGVQLEAADFPSSYIKTEGSTVTRNADNLDYALDSGDIPQSFQLSLDVTPLADGDKYATTDFRLFSTDDSGGTDDEVSTVGHADTYGYTHATGGGVFQLSQADFTAGTETTLSFKLKQEGSNVRAIIVKDNIEKLNTTVAGTLAHSDASRLNIGHWDDEHFSGHFKNIKLWSA